jgi:chemotaxis protein methyltransferase CheR
MGQPDEWPTLDALCRISISRLGRDWPVFARLRDDVLPALATAAGARADRRVQCWSAGCASGEEPYTLSILWVLDLAPRFPGVSCSIVGTDADPELLARAALARYRRSSLREVPPAWLDIAFDSVGADYVLRDQFREDVVFCQQDVRDSLPPGRFDLVLCRNLVFTYFDDALRRRTLARMLEPLRPGGAFVIAVQERLPQPATGLEPWAAELGIYRRAAELSESAPAPGEHGSWN